jgi:hypothetical protein
MFRLKKQDGILLLIVKTASVEIVRTIPDFVGVGAKQ